MRTERQPLSLRIRFHPWVWILKWSLRGGLLAGSCFAQTNVSSVVDSGGADVGQHTSLAIVSGNPAIAYYDVTHHSLKYARNTAADGSGGWTLWTIDQSADVGQYASLAVVGGNPAICYYDATNGDLKFARCSQADGLGPWTITTIDTGGDVGKYNSLTVVSGNPAVSYYDVTNGDLKFARNSAADGSGTWSITAVDTAGDTGQFTSLANISGVPCISYHDVTNGFLRFARNSNATGTGTWASVSVSTMTITGQYTTLVQVAAGRPAISYYSVTANTAVYTVSSNTTGSAGSWTASTVGGSTGDGQYSFMALAATNVPLICFYSSNSGDLKFTRNSLSDGSGSWTATVADGVNNVGKFASMAIVNGSPAIAYYDVTNGDLRFARNTASNGSGTWATRTVDGATATLGRLSVQAIVNGNPAVAYADTTHQTVKYARNTQPDGSGQWITTTLGNLGSFLVFSELVVVAGNPALVYFDTSSSTLQFVRSTDGNGLAASWVTTPVAQSLLDGTAALSLAIVNGNPAVTYGKLSSSGSSSIQLGRSSTADGSGAWTSSTIRSTASSGVAGASLKVLNGKPAVAYSTTLDGSQYTYSFQNAGDANGTLWGGVQLITQSSMGGQTILTSLGGNAAIFFQTDGGIFLTRNNQPDGSGTWTTSTLPSFGTLLSFAIINGVPSITYADGGSHPGLAVNHSADGSGSWTSFTVDATADATNASAALPFGGEGPFISYHDSITSSFKWCTAYFLQMDVQQPSGMSIADGGMGVVNAALGFPQDYVFTVYNYGNASLTGLAITKDGTNAPDFSITSNPASPVPGPSGSSSFTVHFAPSTQGAKTAALHIANNDPSRNPYDISLTGNALSFTQDTDGDGLNDATEFQLASMGFDWQVAQPQLVSTFFTNVGRALPDLNTAGYISNLNASGFYSQSQIQAIYVGTPLLTKTGGQFKLTIAVQKATDMIHFNPFPMSAPQISINAQGQLEFQFSTSDNAAFFLLQSH